MLVNDRGTPINQEGHDDQEVGGQTPRGPALNEQLGAEGGIPDGLGADERERFEQAKARARARIEVWATEGYPEDPRELTPDICGFMTPEEIGKALDGVPTVTGEPGGVPFVQWQCKSCGSHSRTMGPPAVRVMQGGTVAAHCAACGAMHKVEKSKLISNISAVNAGPNRAARRAAAVQARRS